jgi:hypothetical protein
LSDWSIQRVEQLAPDAAAVKAGQSLARKAKWKSVGQSERLLWGECQGSGANPYQVRVDLEDGTSKCSCPSRKLPCKHALGLLMMLASGEPIESSHLPEFVQEWAASRAKRAEAKAARASSPEKPPDTQAQAKRAEKREARIETGLAQLEEWLADILKQGLAAARTLPPQFWSQMAARLIDTQAPGLARRVRELSDLAVSGDEWQSRLLASLARLQLLIDAYRRLDSLPPSIAAETRSLVGWTQSQDTLLQHEGLRDHWQVLGQRQTQEEQVRVQYTWLAGAHSGRIAMLLDFAAGNQPQQAALRIGQVVDAELAYFDGAPRLRTLLKHRFAGLPSQQVLPAAVDIETLQRRFAALLAENPLLERWPAVVGPVKVSADSTRTEFIDAQGKRISASRHFKHAWTLVALAGGKTLNVFGLWDGWALDPVSVEHDGHLFSLGRLGELAVLSRAA